jgi:hypothetical protein
MARATWRDAWSWPTIDSQLQYVRVLGLFRLNLVRRISGCPNASRKQLVPTECPGCPARAAEAAAIVNINDRPAKFTQPLVENLILSKYYY